jgi:hypothetical protein
MITNAMIYGNTHTGQYLQIETRNPEVCLRAGYDGLSTRAEANG